MYIYQSIHCNHTYIKLAQVCLVVCMPHYIYIAWSTYCANHLRGLFFVAKECGKVTSGVKTKKTPVTQSGTYCGSCCKLSLKRNSTYVASRNELENCKFTRTEVVLYKRRLEGYDFKTDDKYNAWLKLQGIYIKSVFVVV